MYPYLFFALAFIGVFSIIENIKWKQKFSLLKSYILLVLFILTVCNSLDFFIELGYDLFKLQSIFRIISSIAVVNLFYLLASNKIPRLAFYIEGIFFISYLFFLNYGFNYPIIRHGIILTNISPLNKFHYLVTNTLMIGSMLYNVVKININTDQSNLYQIKIKKWSYFLLFSLLFIIISIIISSLLYFKKITSIYIDTRIISLFFRLILFLFILLRPKFVDELSFSTRITNSFLNKTTVSTTNFEFLFYSTHYYLHLEANLDDFALKLNHSKAEVLAFLKTQTNDSFNELLNRNRINYLKELLQSKKNESFTIEALSEMSGFRNRKTMYNAFQKYVGVTPTDFINSL